MIILRLRPVSFYVHKSPRPTALAGLPKVTTAKAHRNTGRGRPADIHENNITKAST